MNMRGGYQIPANLHPEETRCVTFQLPADLFYIANFWGAVGELAKWTSYQRTGDDSGLQAANVMALVIDAARENFLNVCNEQMAEPEREIIREIIYQIVRESDNEGDECDMCSKCPNSVHFDSVAQKFYYLDANCNRIDIVSNGAGVLNPDDWQEAGSPPVPDSIELPHENPLYKTVESLQCAKATTLVNEMWNVLSVYEAVDSVMTITETIAAIAAFYATLSPEPVSKTSVAAIAAVAFGAVGELGLEEYRDALIQAYEDTTAKEELICELVDLMVPPVKIAGVMTLNRMTTNDVLHAIAKFEAKFEENQAAVRTVKSFPVSGWIEVTQFKVVETECGCDEYVPNPVPIPPQTEPLNGQFGLYGGVVVGNITTAISPVTSLEAATPRGAKVNERKYLLPAYDAGDHQIGELFVMWEATELITWAMLDTIWKYTGTSSDAENITEVHIKTYYSTGDTELWQLFPDFTGEISTNDSATPGIFGGTVNIQRYPWDDALKTFQAKYLGYHMRFKMESDNTPASVPTGEITFEGFKGKAVAGGNYRATLLPMVFVPKAL